MIVNYTKRRYEALQLATTGAYRIAVRGPRYRVLRVLRDTNRQFVEASAAANGESQSVLDLWRGGLLCTRSHSALEVETDGSDVHVTRTGHQRLAEWALRWQRQRQRQQQHQRESETTP